jgi:AcrR family transcriptional regulator
MATHSPRRRRADAERSIARIVAAARERLSVDPTATTDDIARAAGVGRMTLYGHFPQRADLVEAALRATLRDGEEVLAGIDITGEPLAALRAFLRSSWRLVAESSGLQQAADGVVPAERMRELHGDPAARLTEIIRRGQGGRVFRTDLPVGWLVASVHYLLHGAAAEVRAGRLDDSAAPGVVTATIESIVMGPQHAGGEP